MTSEEYARMRLEDIERPTLDDLLDRPWSYVRDGEPGKGLVIQHYPFSEDEKALHSTDVVYSRAQMQAAYAAGQRAEREACAHLISKTDAWKGRGWWCKLMPDTAEAIAVAIRSRTD